jgi:hypothetical protein
LESIPGFLGSKETCYERPGKNQRRQGGEKHVENNARQSVPSAAPPIGTKIGIFVMKVKRKDF